MIDSIINNNRNYRIIFIHINAICRNMYPDLLKSLRTYTLEEFINTSNDNILSSPSKDILITEPEELLVNNIESHGIVRAKIHELIGSDCNFFIFSRISADSYPSSPASDFIADSKKKNITITRQQWKSIKNRDESLFGAILSELSQDTIEDLYNNIWLKKRENNGCLTELSNLTKSSLLGSSLIFDSGKEFEWIIGSDFKKLKNIVCLELQRNTALNQSAEAYSQFFYIENYFRFHVMQRMIEKHKSTWRGEIENSRSILDRAQADEFPDATSINEIGNPLFYLDFSEIVALREEKSLGDFGIPKPVLRKIMNELVPMRNNLAHMRILSEHDRLIVSQIYKTINRIP